MNKTIITGNLGEDAEIKSSKDNKRYIVFSIANTERDVTLWYKCFIQNEKLIESKLIDYLKKGTKVLVEGKLTANWFEEKQRINYVMNVFQIELLSSAVKTESKTENSVPAKDDDLPF